VLFALIVCGACGGSQGMHGKFRPSSEFTTRDTGLFEDGVDLIEDPQGLEGQWRDDWESDLNDRIARSDVIAVGTVNTLRTDLDLEHNTNYRVVFDFERSLQGEPPSNELNLASRTGAPGYSSIDRDHDKILNRRFIVFMKYAPGSEGDEEAVIAHFHLSPLSQVVLERITQFKESKEPTHIRVIEHTQTPD
jgi:hypothetical protein